MIVMRIREVRSCRDHRRAIIVLEDESRRLTLTFYADADEASRLVQEIRQGPRACHPIYDFVNVLVGALDATPTRVVLEDLNGRGIGGLVCVRRAGAEVEVPCYPPDALALALRSNLPVFATPQALDHAEPAPPSPGSADETGQVAQWLDRVRPVDF